MQNGKGNYAKRTRSYVNKWKLISSIYTIGGDCIVNINSSALCKFKNKWTRKAATENTKEATNDVPLK